VAEQGCGGGFVSATASDDSGEVHVSFSVGSP
jgi:hypothetical protein